MVKKQELQSIDEMANDCYLQLIGANNESIFSVYTLSSYVADAVIWTEHFKWRGQTKKRIVMKTFEIIIDNHISDEEESIAKTWYQKELGNIIDGFIFVAKAKEFVKRSCFSILY